MLARRYGHHSREFLTLRNFSQAAENNSFPILEKLKFHFKGSGKVLEIGSGSGQHAICFAENLPALIWQPTDREDLLGVLAENIAKFGPENLLPPFCFDVDGNWPKDQFNYVFASNVLHIMAASLMPVFFSGVASRLESGGLCCVYGPFRYDGNFTTESNAEFDQWLKQTYPDGGIRDFEAVIAETATHGLNLLHDYAMPANNQLLVFELAGR